MFQYLLKPKTAHFNPLCIVVIQEVFIPRFPNQKYNKQ
jgi:hypothetical protein